MRVACDLVKAGEASGALSAGNSGAMMAVALLVYGRLPGVLRPCIAPAFPTEKGTISVLVDAGANTDCTPEQLLQFGLHANVSPQGSRFFSQKPRLAAGGGSTFFLLLRPQGEEAICFV